MNYTYDLGAVSQPNVFQSREDVSLKMMFVSFQSRNQKYICLSPVTALHILSENMVPWVPLEGAWIQHSIHSHMVLKGWLVNV